MSKTISRPKRTVTKTRKRRLATEADYAAVPITPYPAEEVEAVRKLTTWEGFNNPHLVTLRLATCIVEQDRAGLNQLCAEIGKY